MILKIYDQYISILQPKNERGDVHVNILRCSCCMCLASPPPSSGAAEMLGVNSGPQLGYSSDCYPSLQEEPLSLPQLERKKVHVFLSED